MGKRAQPRKAPKRQGECCRQGKVEDFSFRDGFFSLACLHAAICQYGCAKRIFQRVRELCRFDIRTSNGSSAAVMTPIIDCIESQQHKLTSVSIYRRDEHVQERVTTYLTWTMISRSRYSSDPSSTRHSFPIRSD